MTTTATTENRSWFTIRAKAAKDKTDEDADANNGADADQDEDDAESSAEVLIYDEIGLWGVTASDFDRALKAVGPVKTINMRINSPGGDSFAGIAIYNMLKAHPATIKTRVDGIAASAASLIAMAGDRITMPENTFMVVHEPLALVIGHASDMRAMADDLDRVAGSYANTYAARSGQTLEAVRSLMAEDRLMSAAEAKERGYADETTAAVEMRASFALERLPAKHHAALAAVFMATDPPAADPAAPAPPSGGGDDSAADASFVPEGPAAAESTAPAPPPPETPDAATEAPELGTPELIVAAPAPAPGAAPASPAPAAAPAAYGPEDITATLDLCALAGVPAATAQRFIAAKTPVADVRSRLLEARAKAADAHGIVPYPADGGEAGPGAANGAASAAIIANKRRLQMILKCAEQNRVSMDQAAAMVDGGLWKPN